MDKNNSLKDEEFTNITATNNTTNLFIGTLEGLSSYKS
jgi:hypothetical protein